MKQNVLKKTIALLIIMSMIINCLNLYMVGSFANETIGPGNQEYDDQNLDDYKEIVENIDSSEEVIEDIQDIGTEFHYDENNIEVCIDKMSPEISLDVADENFVSMEYLDSTLEKGEMTDDGTVFYESKGEDVVSAVQLLEEENTIASLRNLLIIDNYENKNDYIFHIEIPDNCRLIYGKEYNENYNEYKNIDNVTDEDIVIINENNELYSIVDKPWANDANNFSLNTYYTIEGTDLIQHIDMDKNTAFPVVADPVIKVLGKAALKALFKSAVAIGTRKYPWASALLNHSMEKKPTDIVYNNGTSLSNYIKQSVKYYYRRQAVNNLLRKTSKTQLYNHRTVKGMQFDMKDDPDLFLGFHTMDMFINATRHRVGAKYRWDVTLVMKDVYDFNQTDYKKFGFAVGTINNVAYLAQCYGILKPYKATVYCSYGVTF